MDRVQIGERVRTSTSPGREPERSGPRSANGSERGLERAPILPLVARPRSQYRGRMTTQVACPVCGTLMREIVWGYGTIADVADAGDVVIGGCVIDVDGVGSVAALQCPECGTRVK